MSATASSALPQGTMSPSRAVLLGGFFVGALDIIDALVFFYIARGATPIRIFQSIAAGLLGRSSFQGGIPTAILGGLLHFFIAFCIAGVYSLASRKLSVLTRHAVVCGMLYGIAVYFVMNQVVVPLSATSSLPFSWPVFLNGIIGHAFLVGLPAALCARLAATVEQ
jgi:hypothetical protein